MSEKEMKKKKKKHLYKMIWRDFKEVVLGGKKN